MGDFEVVASAAMESTLGYHSWIMIILTHALHGVEDSVRWVV